MDGEFAVSGSKLRRLICSGGHDVRSPDDLYHGLAKVAGLRRSVSLFAPDTEAAKFEAATVAGLTLMSDRAYEYATNGTFAALHLRRQSFLGRGQRLESTVLFPDGTRAAPAAPIVVATTSAVAAAAASGLAPPMLAPTGKCLKSRNDAGREAKKAAKAAEKLSRQEKKAEAQRCALANLDRRWRATGVYRCGSMPGGTQGCDRCFRRKKEWKKHVEYGRGDPSQHRTGFIRCSYAAGAIVGADSAADALRRAIATHEAEGITVHGGEGGSAVPTLCAIDELQCQLCDGTQWAPPPPPSGFAGSSQSRVPTRSRSALQQRFCVLAGHLIGEAGYEGMRGQEASQLMLEWGT